MTDPGARLGRLSFSFSELPEDLAVPSVCGLWSPGGRKHYVLLFESYSSGQVHLAFATKEEGPRFIEKVEAIGLGGVLIPCLNYEENGYTRKIPQGFKALGQELRVQLEPIRRGRPEQAQMELVGRAREYAEKNRELEKKNWARQQREKLRPRAEAGDLDACAVIGYLFMKDGLDEEAVPWLERAAEGGISDAVKDLASIRDRGNGTAR